MQARLLYTDYQTTARPCAYIPGTHIVYVWQDQHAHERLARKQVRTCCIQHHFLQRHILQPAQGTTTAASYRCKPGAIRATTVVAYPVEGRCHKVVWLAFGTFCTDLVHHLSASCGDLVRIKPCSLIAFIAKLQHCRVLAVCQAWLLVPDLLGT